jgi:dihydrofolate synthase / folylpolyglutamate synthase
VLEQYDQTIAYLYKKLPVFQKIGKKAIKPKLTNISKLCEALGNPQNDFKSIHVGGTNGKGSSSHFLASILMEAGLKVGLYTSPHLKDFAERFKINGIDIPHVYIIDFVNQNIDLIDRIQPSFFELSVALAFMYFKDEKVDIAVIEVGLGGRYDSTNIIQPLVSLITNIGLDHTDILGDTLEKIAYQKAGIIKETTPVVISEVNHQTREVFIKEAKQKNAAIIFAQDQIRHFDFKEDNGYLKARIINWNGEEIHLWSSLIGEYQIPNIIGVVEVIKILIKLDFKISKKDIEIGIQNVVTNTNLKGRWQILNSKPLIICDTGHNAHALALTFEKLATMQATKKHLILGFVKDKDITNIVSYFPPNAVLHFCTFDSFRALQMADLQEFVFKNNLKAQFYEDVNQAITYVKELASEDDIIFIGGSTYLVAEIKNL